MLAFLDEYLETTNLAVALNKILIKRKKEIKKFPARVKKLISKKLKEDQRVCFSPVIN